MKTGYDHITLQRIEKAHPAVRAELECLYWAICAVLKGRAIIRFARVFSTWEEQALIYAQGRTKPGKIVTYAPAGKSYHNYGLAVDIVLLVDRNGDGTFESASWETNVDFDGDGEADWMEVVDLFKHYGWEWGGDWGGKKKDRPHFQKTFGLKISQLLELHNQKKFIPGTKYVQIKK